MIQGQIQTLKIKDSLDYFNIIYQDLLGYKPEQTSLEQITESNWKNFAEARELNPKSSGIYLPRNQTAIIQEGNLLSLFHEYFGHGLYCEQSILGRKLVNLERRLLEEERQEFQGKKFNLEDVKKFRKENKSFLELREFMEKNLGIYEGFAVWTEYFLSKELGLRELFERKYESLSKGNKDVIEKITSFNQQYGNLATFYNFGLARRTTSERVKKLLEEIYKDKVKNIKLALLYGSRKEFSDVDVFIVDENLQEIESSWIDIRICSKNELEENINFFDVSAIDPLLTGEFILGDKEYLNEIKNKIFNQPITDKAIKLNLERSKEQRELSLNHQENSFFNRKGLSYSLTYLTNALALQNGLKLLTKEELILYSEKASVEGERPLQLEGGKERNAT